MGEAFKPVSRLPQRAVQFNMVYQPREMSLVSMSIAARRINASNRQVFFVRTETKTHDWFLRDPRTRKWIRQCLACGQYGRDPQTPETIPKVNFENMFPIMELDEHGLCQYCRDRVK